MTLHAMLQIQFVYNNAPKSTHTYHYIPFTHIIWWTWQRFFTRDPPCKLTL